MHESGYVFDATAENFQHAVVERSREVALLVDFWAPWCAPCRALMPVLDKLAAEQQGKLLVARVNTDEQPELAAANGIRSLPTVQLVRDARVLEEFHGALPEGEVRRLIEPHLERESDGLVARAREALARGEEAVALQLLEEAHGADPQNDRVPPLLATVLIDTGRLEEAERLLRGLPAGRQEDAELRAVFARLRLARIAADALPAAELAQTLEREPGALEARWRLGAVQALQGAYEEALQCFLEIMQRDRGFRDDAGRRGMLDVFELLGGSGPLVSRYRARMSAALY